MAAIHAYPARKYRSEMGWHLLIFEYRDLKYLDSKMSGTVCSYSGCKRSYSADKDVSFFPFPGDPKSRCYGFVFQFCRRKKWMDNCGNTELKDMDERQLRRKRICSDHFILKAFSRPESRTALNDTAVPIPAKKPPATKQSTPAPVATKSSAAESPATPKSGEGSKKPPPKLQKRNSKIDPPTPKASEAENKKNSGANLEKKTAEEQPVAEPEKVTTPASTSKNSDTSKRVTRSPKKSLKPDNVPSKTSETEEKKSTSGDLKQKEAEKVPPAAASPLTPENQKITTPVSSPKPIESPKKSPVKFAKKSKPGPPTPKPSETDGKKDSSGNQVPKSSEGVATESSKSVTPVSTPKSSESPKKPPTKVQKKILKPGALKRKPPEADEKKDSSGNVEEPKKSKVETAVPVTNEPQNISTTAIEIIKKNVPKLKKIMKTGPSKPAVLTILEKKSIVKTDSVKKTGSEATKSTVTELSKPGSAPTKLIKKVVKTQASSSDISKVVKKVVKTDPSSTDASKLIKKVVKTDVSSVGIPKVLKKVVKSEASRPKLPFYPDACTELSTLDSQQGPDENLFEGFYVSLKRFLKLSGRWTIGGVQWDPQGKRKVIMVSEPEISPNGRPCVKRCLQFFEDKALKVFIDGLDMTDVFEMNSYADKEDVAALICRVAEASSCCGVPEMISDDLPNFPNAKKRSTSYFDSECPGIIPNDSFDAICSACKKLRSRVLECRQQEKKRLNERRIRSQEKEFRHPFGEALYTMFGDLVDETDPSKPKKKRNKETFFRKFLTDTRYKMNGDAGRTERIYVEKPISYRKVSKILYQNLDFPCRMLKRNHHCQEAPVKGLHLQCFLLQDLESWQEVQQRKMSMMDTGLYTGHTRSFTDDGQEYELIAEVEPGSTELVEMKPNPNQYEIIEVDDETLAKLASSRNQVVMLPEAASSSSSNIVTRIDANDPNLSQILKAINTSQARMSEESYFNV
ncbi:hypothetical protein Ocin01_14969, partial [Orchesella cincta]